MNDYQALSSYNRSEAPSSVALSMVLGEPSLGRTLIQALSGPRAWTMWDWNTDQNVGHPLTLSDAGLEATALFFPFRDIASDDPVHSDDPWMGELDVVAIVPGHLVIGFELKVLSTTGKLTEQMNKQVAGLKLLATVYNCRFLAQVALAPAFPSSLPARINRLSYIELKQVIEEVRSDSVHETGLLSLLARQVDHVLMLTKHSKQNSALYADISIGYVTLDELRSIGNDTNPDYRWVGVLEGIDDLHLWSRPRWKVAKERPGNNWYPLLDVVARIEQLISYGKAPDQKNESLSDIQYVSLEKLRHMGQDPANASKWVGATEGIENLRINTRARWQVGSFERNRSWHRLPKVVDRINQIISSLEEP